MRYAEAAAQQLIPADPRQFASHRHCVVSSVLPLFAARAAEFGRYAAEVIVTKDVDEVRRKKDNAAASKC